LDCAPRWFRKAAQFPLGYFHVGADFSAIILRFGAIIPSVKSTAFILASFALLSACTTQPRVQPKSPECLAAIQKGEDRKAKGEEVDLKARESIETDRLKIKNLELDDQIATQQERPAKNRRAIALLKSHIETNETALRLGTELEKTDETLSQSLVDAACQPQAK